MKAEPRREALNFARELKRRKSELRRRNRFYKFYLPAAAIFLGGVFGLILWRTFREQSEVNRGLIALRSAYQDQRLTEARLTDFNYAPTLRGTDERVNYVQRDLAASLLLREVGKKSPSAAAHHAAGQYYLASREFGKAVDQFRASLQLDPNDAKTQADLGAALLELGKLQASDAGQTAIQAFAESLQHLNRALQLNGSLAAALFNRALLYQYMKLPAQAEKDWRSYLAMDHDSAWAGEAKQNLQAVEEQQKATSYSKQDLLRQFQNAHESRDQTTAWKLISSYHNRAGNVVFEAALDSYFDALSNNRRDRAETARDLLKYAGNVEKERAGENYFFELAHFYATSPNERLVALEKARSQMKTAHEGWGRLPVADSLTQFSHAKELFEKAADDWEATFAEYWVIFCLYQQHQTQAGWTRLQPLLNLAQSKSYLWLSVRMFYLSSILQYNLTNYSRALELAERSLSIANDTGDLVGQLNGLSSLIEYYRYLNQLDKSLSYVQLSLALLDETTLDPIQGCRHYGFVATSLAFSGWYDAAAAYQKVALQYAFDTALPATISINLAFLSQIESRLKRFDEALSTASRALEIAKSNATDPSSKDRMAYASLQMAHVYRQSDNCPKAIESYDRAINLYQELDFQTQIYQAYKGRLLCYLAQGNDALAQQEITTAIDLIESYRDKIVESGNRETFYDAEQSVYDLAIGFQYTKLKDPERAFDYSELSRGRSLLTETHADAHPYTSENIKEQLPGEIQLVQFAMLSDQLIIWVISGKQLAHVPVPITGEELQKKINNYVQLLSQPSDDHDEEIASDAKDLHDILIKPVEHLLDAHKQLLIVPDKTLNLLPFGSLISRTSGKYLIEDYVPSISPSASMLILASKEATFKGGSREERILSVGNPHFDRKAYPALPDLPSAAWEATTVASFYRPQASRLLVGDDARVKSVINEIADADIVHFALHAVLDQQFPERSRFLLTGSPGSGDGPQNNQSALFASDIKKLELTRTRLAVLSACETGSGRYFGGEGVMNMARPFMRAGVPLVIASLWRVESNSTARLMVDFHRLRTQGGLTTAQALQQAQLAMLRSSDTQFHQPYYWAPFVLIGGYASF